MKAGVIGVPDYDFDEISSFSSTKQEGDTELEACLEVRQTEYDAFDGYTVQTGRAAREEIVQSDQVSIEGGSISVGETDTVETRYTDFVAVPGEVVAVANGRGTFAYDMIASQTAAATISRAEIRLDRFADTMDDLSETPPVPWQVGFYGRSGEAEKGVIYGDLVLEDGNFGSELQKAPKNQLGLIVDTDDNIKLTVTSSGYIEIYQPSNYDAIDFSEFIVNHVIPNLEA